MTTLAALGAVMQLAFCPADCHAALRHWLSVGAGPFFHIPHVALDDVCYRGQPSEIDFGLWLGYLGDLQIEIIQQHNTAPSMFRDWRAAGHEGVQHLCVLVSSIAQARTRAESAGGTIIQEAQLPAGAGAVIYVDFGAGPGTVTEFLEIGAEGRAGFAMMRDTHRNWDGTDPIRQFG